ncbi:MAG: dimethyl sulfoxide reductase anchor subunit [Thiothrix sp.]|uniref:dimethyl sulfoxide reductase anchor subunit family protein n=1 Tax=Thiothrix sp. TaxID=1032 RepID=UPI002622997F|nr:DmsC/YnfH family molybdoenzyme membrane anchor subunit [Thiothrix sp.]MDD5391613.1 dimethyl sulfoxide reductase anchor subunit [Thiothrix sp.]
MHPAFSVIFLTTLIGAGQGLFLALYTGQVYATFGVLGGEMPPVALYVTGSLLVALLMGLGLFASFFHLGRPERAWRAATKWRTSWLAREVIVLPAFSGIAVIWGALYYFGIDPVVLVAGAVSIHLSLVVGALATALAFLLYLCTGMIYAAIRFIQEWATPLTVVNYLLLGGASGFTLSAALAGSQDSGLVTFYAMWAVIITLIGFVTRMYSLRRNAKLKMKSSACTAIGVRHPKIKQISQGAMGGSFNTREFFHHQTPQFMRMIKTLFPIAVFVLPVALLVIGWGNGSVLLLALAFVVQYLGLLAERWFFFAQANHPQNIYYQAT